MTSKRYFTVTYASNGFTKGRFRGELPSIAAKNAARQVLKHGQDTGAKNPNSANFTITETARSIPKDQRGSFSYSCKRVKLATPKKISVPGNGPTITQSHKIVVNPTGKVNSKAAMNGGGGTRYASYGGEGEGGDYNDYEQNDYDDIYDDTESQA
jgi:hypothetical protein